MKETKTIQCYPNDREINETIATYNDFGWELVSNQHCQTEDSEKYYTFNKLTFNREKASPWYNEVCEIETDYNLLKNRYDALSTPPAKPEMPNASLALLLLLGLGLLILGIWALSINSKHKKAVAAWEESSRPQLAKLSAQMLALRKKASALVNA